MVLTNESRVELYHNKEIILENSYPNSYPVDIRAVKAIAGRVFPTAPTQIERVVEGVSTYVYRIGYRNETFYLRVLPEEDASFSPEVTVHTQLRQMQVKVPEVIYFEHYNEALQRSIMVTTEIKGHPISRSTLLSTEELHAILGEAGRDLARINSISVDGFGWVERDQPYTEHSLLRAQWSAHRAFMLEHWDADLAFLARNTLHTSEITQLEQLLSRYNSWLDVEQAYLAHGDFDITHIYQDNGHYTGIIDFGEIRGTSRWYDLGLFHMCTEEDHPWQLLPALLSGYGEIISLSTEHEQLIRFTSILIRIRTLSRVLQKRPHTQYQLQGFRDDLAALL